MIFRVSSARGKSWLGGLLLALAAVAGLTAWFLKTHTRPAHAFDFFGPDIFVVPLVLVALASGWAGLVFLAKARDQAVEESREEP